MYEIIRYFLKLGVTGFGGPLLLIQQMRRHYAEERKQISLEEFDQAFTLIKAMPGPIAFQMAVFLGRRFRGFGGGLAAGVCLLLPSFLLMLVIGFFYRSFADIAFVTPVLDGFLYSVSAVILLSLRSLVYSNRRHFIFFLLAAAALLLSWNQSVPEPLLIIGAGLAVILLHSKKHPGNLMFSFVFLLVDWGRVYELFKIGLVSGAFVFGTGFALIPVLQSNLVDLRHWLTLKEFSDAVVFGQMTPGPVTIAGALLGYQISGLAGALAITTGIFLMPFVHMVTWFPYAVRWLSRQRWIASFIVGATAAVVGTILTTLIKMNAASYVHVMFWVVFLLNLAVFIKRPRTSIILMVMLSGLLNLFVAFAAVNAV